jgi:hypothetical protein
VRDTNVYFVQTEHGYEDLYRRLTDQPRSVKSELGKLRSLPPFERKSEGTAGPKVALSNLLDHNPSRGSEPPNERVVLFEILEGFALKGGFDGLVAKVIEVLDNIDRKSLPPFAVECPWLDEVDRKIRLIKTKAPSGPEDEKELLRLTKLRRGIRDKLARVRWIFELLFTNPELREAIPHYLDEQAYAECINGIMERENYLALGLCGTSWSMIHKSKLSCSLWLSEENMRYMEQGCYEDDSSSPQREAGLREYTAYPIDVFPPRAFFERVLAQLICHLSQLPEETKHSPQLSTLLNLKDWRFSKCAPSMVAEFK